MKRVEPTPSSAELEQVYLLDRDAGLLCRILGLYAARGLDVLRADYAHAAQNVMRLDIGVANTAPGTEDTLRVLVEKAATFVGVLAAAEQAQQRHPSAVRLSPARGCALRRANA
ncbi:MAG: hypothetical protein WAQ05_01050 [Rubrivivax sp.]